MSWVCEHVDSNNQQEGSTVTIWDTEDNALNFACYQILNFISRNFDYADPDALKNAKKINDLVVSEDWDVALTEFQDLYCVQNWYVYEIDIQDKPTLIVPLSFPDDDKDEEVGVSVPASFAPIEGSGATCRGPCQLYNEYGTPDNPSGTYMCTGCKIMAKAFNG